MSYFLGRVYMGGLLTSDAPDPITPADGIQNFIGDLDIAGTLYMGGNNVDLSIAKDAAERIYSPADSQVNILAGGNLTIFYANTTVFAKSLSVLVPDLTTTLADGSAGAHLSNATAAVTGARIQHSPHLMLEGQGFKTDATAGTVEVQMGLQVQPVTGAAAPTGDLVVWENIGDAGYNKLWAFKSDGTFGNVSGAAAKIDLSIAGDLKETLHSTGLDNITIMANATNCITVTSSLVSLLREAAVVQAAFSSGTHNALKVTAAALTSLTTADNPDFLLDASADIELDGGAGALALFTTGHIKARTIKAEAAQTITEAATWYIDANPAAGANITLTDAYALLTPGRLKAASVEATAGYCIEGAGTSRQVMRMATLRITGVTDNTQVTLEMFDAWNSEAIATETVTEGSGGTRFENNAAGNEITIKTLSQEALVSTGHHIHSNDNGSDWNLHVAESSGDLTVTATNPTTGAAIVFSDIGNGKIIDVNFGYLTST